MVRTCLYECVALTQNFVSVVELPRVLNFLRYTPDQISGFKAAAPQREALFDDFCARLKKYDSALTEEALERIKPRPGINNTLDWRERLCGDQEASFSLGVDADELGDVPW